MWIYESSEWPKFIWDQNKITPLLIKVRYLQGKLLGRMEHFGFESRQESTLNTLANEILKSSAIEGEILNLEEVRSSIARRLGIEMAGLKSSSRNVEGIVEMMLDATQKFNKTLTAERLFDWHAALFPTGRSGMQKITVGAWRLDEEGPMQVVSGAIGREKVHFQAPPASALNLQMEKFLKWFQNENDIDPVLKAGIAHLWFVTIHPFDDGNGRIARAITDMALARADGIAERFYSMSVQIEQERKNYYLQLESQQRGKIDITSWLHWFLKCLEIAISGAEKSLESVLYKARFRDFLKDKIINNRQRLIVNMMLDDFKGFMNTLKYAKLAKCSPDTALRDIQNLVEIGVMVKNPGGGRSTSYRLGRLDEPVNKR